MEVTLNRSLLLDALESVSRAVPSRPSHVILGLFHLTATSTSLTIRGFDLTLAIERTIPVIDGCDAVFMLPAKLTTDILSRLSDAEVTILIDIPEDEELAPCHTLKSGSAQTKLLSLSPSEFPLFPTPDSDVERVSFPAEVFVGSCEKCSKVASTDDTKHILTGVNISGTKNKLDFMSTDGHRMALLSVDVEIDFSSKTFPVRALSEIGRLAKKTGADEITIALTDESLFVEFDGGQVYSRMLQGVFPNCERLIPDSFSSSIELKRKPFLAALELVGIIAEQEKKQGVIKLESKDGKLEISSTAVDMGTAKQTIDCPEELQYPIAFNVKYLLDAVRFFDGDTILMQSNSALEPVVFTEPKPMVQTEIISKKSQYLVMPIQIRA